MVAALMLRDDLLAQMRDLQPASEPSIWPPAPGWWLLLIATIGPLALLFWRQLGRHPGHYRRARLELQGIANARSDERELLVQLSRWLRKVVLFEKPEATVAGLHGEAWLRYLDQAMPASPFSQGAGRVFASQVYTRHPRFDRDELLALCQDWLDARESITREQGQHG